MTCDFWIRNKGLYYRKAGNISLTFASGLLAHCSNGQGGWATQVDVSQLRNTGKENPGLLQWAAGKPAWHLPWTVTYLPSALQGDTTSLFQGCSLSLYKHSWKDSSKQKSSVPLLIRHFAETLKISWELSPSNNTFSKHSNLWFLLLTLNIYVKIVLYFFLPSPAYRCTT